MLLVATSQKLMVCFNQFHADGARFVSFVRRIASKIHIYRFHNQFQDWVLSSHKGRQWQVPVCVVKAHGACHNAAIDSVGIRALTAVYWFYVFKHELPSLDVKVWHFNRAPA